MISFPEHGGGPAQVYEAEGFSETLSLYESEDLKVMWAVAYPPTTATRTVVAGLFALERRKGAWVISDSRRFEAIGKDSGAEAEATQSENAEPHVSLTLFQGGRGHSYEQCASYKVVGGKFHLDAPDEKPHGGKSGGGQPANRSDPERSSR